ncbi:hypothetical protein H4R18_004415 [Coemansia javaensis]|uniref:DUF747-domain-containing protein n=1 Tax=Coemansia javaensis TaxID=2761396 RepID=A0A9W8HAW2_9FUNG|nr:hypothetical protein H4R18_004415 [Coemansia javaensis]
MPAAGRRLRADEDAPPGPGSADPLHKRRGRAPAPAEAPHDPEAPAASPRHSDDSASGDGDGAMTITLKGPRRGGEAPVPAVYLDGTASLWDHYVAELEASEVDPGVHLKRRRVGQLLRVPWNVEKLLWFGVAICFDALLHVFSILPARFARAVARLAAGLARGAPALAADACARAAAHVMPAPWVWRAAAWAQRGSGGGGGGGGAARWASPAQLFDFYRGLLLIATCAALCRIDAAQMYHGIRAQSSLKLYFIFSALDVFDRLLATFGHDALDALQSTTSDPWARRWRSGAGYFAVAQIYMLAHTLVLFYQVITLNVAVNAYSDQLLSLLISNQFVEIKSNVFKKWEKEMLFQIGCADSVERFQEIVFLFIIILRNLAELSGTAGLSPLFAQPPAAGTAAAAAAAAATTAAAGAQPAAQTPVSFAPATPSAFGPLVPTWMSMPMVHRILTPVLMVLGTEILVDWIKHAFVTKLNWIRPEIYPYYIDVLSRDLACARSGSGVRAAAAALVAQPPSSADGGADAASGPGSQGAACDAERNSSETLAGEPEQPRARSASVLGHAALRTLQWVRSSVFADAPGADAGRGSGDAPRPGRPGHRRTGSTTRPQLFVDQSSRVARRLGLAPLPLACLIILMVVQVSHILLAPARPLAAAAAAAPGWAALDAVGWGAVGLIAYALLVCAKLVFSSRLMQFAWARHQAFERRAAAAAAAPGAAAAGGLGRFDDATKRPDRDEFFEVGRLADREPGDAEWERQRPKWSLDNIERYSLFKSRIT